VMTAAAAVPAARIAISATGISVIGILGTVLGGKADAARGQGKGTPTPQQLSHVVSDASTSHPVCRTSSRYFSRANLRRQQESTGRRNKPSQEAGYAAYAHPRPQSG